MHRRAARARTIVFTRSQVGVHPSSVVAPEPLSDRWLAMFDVLNVLKKPETKKSRVVYLFSAYDAHSLM